MPSITAFIPMRSGSKRVSNKNVRTLGAHPLCAYTIAAAQDSGVFARVVVSTDSQQYAAIAQHYGATVLMRPPEFSQDNSPDIQWIRHALETYPDTAFSILRVTSPFRQPETIQRAWKQFARGGGDSLRAVERVKQHPGKMWRLMQGIEGPLSPLQPAEYNDERMKVPHHSMPTQMLPEVYAQNASLEMAWSRVIAQYNTISGNRIMPFHTEGHEGFDLNTEDDWLLAEALLAKGLQLPTVDYAPFEGEPKKEQDVRQGTRLQKR